MLVTYASKQVDQYTYEHDHSYVLKRCFDQLLINHFNVLRPTVLPDDEI